MAHLYDPLTLRGLTIRNRIGVSPMCMYSSDDGFANDWHLVHLGARAVGGAGLIICEATAVHPVGRISLDDLGIWKDDHIAFLRRITDFIRQHGVASGIQLAHAGRKATRSQPYRPAGTPLEPDETWQPVAPTNEPFSEKSATPHQLTTGEVKGVIEDFKQAAIRAVKAGFDLIEIHGAHGYLVHEFYSPLTNNRSDEYGGSFDNRIRFLMEIVAATREVIPEAMPLAVRISASDWVEGGWTVEDSVALAKRLKSAGVDLIDCSSGGAVPNVTYAVGAGYQVPLSEAVRKGADIATAAVGMITEPMQADALIRNGRADIALLGREMLRNPYWALHAADAVHQPDEKAVPLQYKRGF